MIPAARRAGSRGPMNAMLKTMLLASALLSSSAFAYDQADRDARLSRLVDAPVIVQPGQAALIQYAPRVVYAPAPSSDSSDQAPVVCEEPTVFISQPAQTAGLRVK